MTMKQSEKKLIALAGLLFAVLLLVRVLPLAFDYYKQQREDLALLQERIERYRTLIVDTAEWQRREKIKEAAVTDLKAGIFQGSDPNLVSSSLQRNLRQLMTENHVDVRETGVARYNYVGKWLMVEQDMSFSLDQAAILPFLRALDAARPSLHVSAFSINRNRRSYNGSITVIGFAKAPDSSDKTVAPAAAGQGLGRSGGNVRMGPRLQP